MNRKNLFKPIALAVSLLLMLSLFACGGAKHDYTKDVQTYEFQSRHWDESDFKVRYEEFAKTLSDNKDIKDFIAEDIPSGDASDLTSFFEEFKGKNVEYVYTKCHTLSRVKDYDEYNDMRGVLEFRFRVKDGKKLTEYTAMVNIARLGNAKGMKWKMYKLLWKDTGVDVSDVKIKQLDQPAKGEEVCIMTTDAGVIKMRLFPKEAPKAVENWKKLAKDGFYNGTPFARVIKDFVIQGGALDGSGDEALSSFDGFFEDEVEKGLYNFNGALCLGNNGPHTNGNQFYIVQCPKTDETVFPFVSLPVNVEKKYAEVGGLPALDGRYTVFGQVYEGMDIVERIASQATDENDAPRSNPVKVIKIEFETVK